MWKAVLAGTAALALAGSTLVYAQQRYGDPERRGPDRAQAWQPSPEDRAAFIEARIAALRAGLQLRSEQEQFWPEFEAAVRDLVRLRQDRIEARRNEAPSADLTERLRRRGEALSGMGAALQRLANAQAPLYGALDASQKRRFAVLARPMSAGMGGRGGPDRMGRHGMGGRGMGHHGMHGHGYGARGGDHWREHHGARGGDHWREHHGARGDRDDRRDGDRGPVWRGREGMDGRGDRDRDWRGGRGMDDRGPAWRERSRDGQSGYDRDRRGPRDGEERL